MTSSIRAGLALLLGVAALPLSATPASAHGFCTAWADQPTSPSGYIVTVYGGFSCHGNAHGPITTKLCLQKAPVDVAVLYENFECVEETWDYYASLGVGRYRWCPFETGFYRVTFTADMPGHSVSATSLSALILSNC